MHGAVPVDALPLTDFPPPPCTEAVLDIRKAVGDKHVLGAVSGGVDSTVAAALMARAIGPRFHALLVDNGLLRKDERVQVRACAAVFAAGGAGSSFIHARACLLPPFPPTALAQVIKRLRDELGVNLRAVDASERFLNVLKGVSDPEAKRKAIGAEFIHVFQEEAAAMGAEDRKSVV